MTERMYICMGETIKPCVPQGLCGESMILRDWLKNLDAYDDRFEDASDRSVIDYIYYEKGKRLEEVRR